MHESMVKNGGISGEFCFIWASLVAHLLKNLSAIRETLGSIPGLGRSFGEGNSYPLQYSGLENSMDCVVHGVTKCWARTSNFHFDVFKFRVKSFRVFFSVVVVLF